MKQLEASSLWIRMSWMWCRSMLWLCTSPQAWWGNNVMVWVTLACSLWFVKESSLFISNSLILQKSISQPWILFFVNLAASVASQEIQLYLTNRNCVNLHLKLMYISCWMFSLPTTNIHSIWLSYSSTKFSEGNFPTRYSFSPS
jgi:hypothetical protein